MKFLPSINAIILYIVVFFSLCYIDNKFINWITNNFENHDLRLIASIILWVLSVSGILWLTKLISSLILIGIERLWQNKFLGKTNKIIKKINYERINKRRSFKTN